MCIARRYRLVKAGTKQHTPSRDRMQGYRSTHGWHFMQAARALFTHTFIQKTMGMLLMVTLVLPLWVPKLVLVLVLLLVLLLLAFLAAAFGGFSPVLAGVWLR